MKLNVYGVLVAGVLLGGSCKKKQDDIGPDACNTAAARVQALQTAANTYASSPTRANCEAFRSAANSFIDAAARCNTVSQADVQQARDDVRDLDCN